jgi:hypothetical protein
MMYNFKSVFEGLTVSYFNFQAIEMEPDNGFYKNNLQLVEDILSQGGPMGGPTTRGPMGGPMGGAATGASAGGNDYVMDY